MRDFWLSWGYLVGVLAGIFLAVRFILPYVLPFALGAAVAVIIEPAVELVQRRGKLSRGLAVAVVLSLVMFAGLYLLYLIMATLIGELLRLYQQLPQNYPSALVRADELVRLFGEALPALPDPLRLSFEAQLASLYQDLTALVGGVVQGVRRAPGLVTVWMVAILAAFFISRDRREINRFLLNLLPAVWRERARRANADVLRSVLGLVNAQLVLVGLTATFATIALRLAGVAYAGAIGLAVGVLDLLPVLGPGLIFLPWSAYALLTGQPGLSAYLIAVYVVMAGVRYAIQPRLIGRRIGMHPLATLLALYLGVQLFGVNGLLIGPLAAIIVKALVQSGILPLFPGRPVSPR
ncbi:MAG TPA: sporulation integral membrane protein YtvI [Bacillota bacterium]|nr:sporulation integral membrane protein YtvI [Bacillota bacterium]